MKTRKLESNNKMASRREESIYVAAASGGDSNRSSSPHAFYPVIGAQMDSIFLAANMPSDNAKDFIIVTFSATC